jgi:hypothetical protein
MTKQKINKKDKPTAKEKPSAKGMHSYMPEPRATKDSRKVLTAKDKPTANNIEKCQQTQCEFWRNGSCKPCEECGAKSREVNNDCVTCFKCENKPNSLRWNNKTSMDEGEALKIQLLDVMTKLENFQKKKEEEEILKEMAQIKARDKARGSCKGLSKGEGKSKNKEDDGFETKTFRSPSYVG